MKIQVYPSLLSANAGKFQEEIERIEEFVDGIHFDVMDGHFVPNLSFGAQVLRCLKTRKLFDVHLMVTNPDSLLEDFAEAGAHSLSVHFEVCPHLFRTLDHIRGLGMKAGVVINPSTSFESAKEGISYADFVLVMSVNPGFGGQKFLPEVLPKVRAIRSFFPEKDIQIDGGIDAQTVLVAKEAGANIFISGSYLFGSTDVQSAIEYFYTS
jgi:ribulose-phosphate 3-epimerase